MENTLYLSEEKKAINTINRHIFHLIYSIKNVFIEIYIILRWKKVKDLQQLKLHLRL